MNLKYILRLVACLISVIAFASCNSNDNEITITDFSTDAQISSFNVKSIVKNPVDSVTYPILAKTKFMIQNKGGHRIFNLDSLPVHTDIRTMQVSLGFSSTPAKIDLVYKDISNSDSIVAAWNTTDSIKFMKKGDEYFPRFKVVAPKGDERLYRVNFLIHKQDPDSIKWYKMTNFGLKKAEQTKVLINVDSTTLYAFSKGTSRVTLYTSPIKSPSWSAPKETSLPNDALVNSLQITKDLFIIITSSEDVYTSPVSDGLTWTKKGLSKVQSIVGKLPEIDVQKPRAEFLIIYTNDANKVVYAKTANFDTAETLKLTGSSQNEVLDAFPLKDHNSHLQTLNKVNYLIVTGGKDNKGNIITNSWIIKNVALATDKTLAEVNIAPTFKDHVMPHKSGITTFLYDNLVYGISSDSLSLYNSTNADSWKIANVKQKLHKDMKDMNMPSVIVDKEKNIWIFGGVSSENSATYSQQVWRGRVNRLAHIQQ